MKKVFLGAALFSVSQVFAAITPSLVSVTPTGSQFTWTYSVNLAQDQNAVGGPAPAQSTPGGVGVISTTADYFTIYDFAGFVAGSNTQPANWSFQSSATGSTPQDVIPTDTGITNLTWYLNSGTTLVGPQNLGTFSARSIYSLETLANFSGQGTRNSGTAVGTEISNIGTVGVPSGVPEPGTYALIGGGMLALGVLRRRV